jgi:phage terminase large subunit
LGVSHPLSRFFSPNFAPMHIYATLDEYFFYFSGKMDFNVNIAIPDAYSGLFDAWRFLVYYGGRGGGKSWAVVDALLLMGMQKPIRVLCARELQNSIADSVHRLLSDRISEHNLDGFYKITQKSIEGVNGTIFLFKGLKHNYREIKSTEGIDICWVEEAENVSSRSWEVLIPTIRKESSQIIVTFNTKNVTDATYSRFIINRPENCLVRKVGWRDNPFFPKVLDQERRYMQARDKEAYDHIWEGEPDTRYSGAVYAKEVAALHAKGHISDKVVHDPDYPVYTLWDLGFGDTCVIWFYQVGPGEILLIDYYENNGEGVGHYCDLLKGKIEGEERFAKYNYENHYVPQDAKKKLMEANGKSIVEQAWKDHGVRMTVINETTHANRNAALRQLMPKLWFNSTRCATGIDALMAYHYEYNDDMQRFGKDPVHDWSSHASTSLELLPSSHGKAVTIKQIEKKHYLEDFLRRHKKVTRESSDPYRIKSVRKKK